ncbi:CDK12_13 [Mytilus coruscus]|uniref:CDK12_13 n=1 Tax=Mytilus coruscus TaxID=42192 RepID=A0A6J8A1U1_MYTCO|nr:CDK12_13 [Mytilus coruscus]
MTNPNPCFRVHPPEVMDHTEFNQNKHERPSTSSVVLNKSPLSQKPILNQRRFSASPISSRRRQSVSPSPAKQCRRQSVSPSPAQQCRRQSFSPSSGQPSRRQSVSPSSALQNRRQSVSPSPAQQCRRQSVSPSPGLQSRRHSVSPPKEHIQRDSKSQKSTFSKYSNVDSVLFVELSVQSTSTDRKRLNGPNYIRGRSNSTTSTSSVRSRSTCSVKSVNLEESSEINLSITRSKSLNDIASVFDSGFHKISQKRYLL